MRLAAKLTAGVTVVVLVAMTLFDLHLVRKEIRVYDADLDRAGRIGRAFTRLVETVWRKRGDDVTRRLVYRSSDDLDEAGARLEWTPLDAPEAAALVPESVRRALVRGRVHHIVDEEVGLQTWYAPMDTRTGRQATLIYTESYADVLHLIRTTHRDIVLTTILMLLGVITGTLGLGYWFVGRPIARLRTLTTRLGEGNGEVEGTDILQHDEIGTLASEFDRMAKRLKHETQRRERAVEQLRHTDRLTTVGQLASGVAHELGTPLNVIAGHAEMIVDGDLDAPQVERSAQVIIDQTVGMTRLIRQLLSLARRTDADREPLDLRDVVLRTVNTLQPLARQRRVSLRAEGPTAVARVVGDPAQLQQALTNIVVNAIQATPSDREVVIVVDTCDRVPPPGSDGSGPPETYATLSVVDAGSGIAAETLPRLFDPFFTTKPAGEGTGLGLPVTDGIVRDHGGWIEVANAASGGACFTIFLPAAVTFHRASA